MLRRIGRNQLRLGMFIERVEGRWLDNPFWRRRFLLTDPDDLARLFRSEIDVVVIDESRGTRAGPPVPDAPRAADLAETAPFPRPSPRSPLRAATQGAAPASGVPGDEVVGRFRKATHQMFADARNGRSIDPGRSSRIVTEIVRSIDDNPVAMVKLTRLKSIDAYTYVHSVAVSGFMVSFGRHLGMASETVHEMGVAGLMHDIGKVRLPPVILTKTGSLDADEIAIIRTHPRHGHEIVEASGFSDLVLDVTMHHHERIDGSGYPERLAGEEISLAARIGAICDVYDAVTTLRPYKRAWSSAEALAQMTQWEGHFDRDLLDAFIDFLEQGEETRPILDAGGVPLPFVENGFSDPSGDLRGEARRF
ncbi:HD-GYP domain-containing protein [Aureimonas pseudogalii]|uniref:Putative hydrolase (HD superfamily) n=1 Tax=Aureimonas pseudogalii TaxID=1744844 RepID=A0A7W6ECK1_9HYPH|nr:HD-GYP domain-containing protein [Aureimonas pseudogalii]MBB3997541.1 putative hydrolase (HD superfamily) [Aureimonas pseudogalii]